MNQTTTPIHTCENCGSDDVEVEYNEVRDLYNVECNRCRRHLHLKGTERIILFQGRQDERPAARSATVPRNTAIGEYQKR